MARVLLALLLATQAAALQRPRNSPVAPRKAAPINPEQQSLEAALEPVANVLATTLRVGTCALMVHHGIDKVQNVDGFSANVVAKFFGFLPGPCLLYTSPSPRDATLSRMPSSA